MDSSKEKFKNSQKIAQSAAAANIQKDLFNLCLIAQRKPCSIKIEDLSKEIKSSFHEEFYNSISRNSSSLSTFYLTSKNQNSIFNFVDDNQLDPLHKICESINSIIDFDEKNHLGLRMVEKLKESFKNALIPVPSGLRRHIWKMDQINPGH